MTLVRESDERIPPTAHTLVWKEVHRLLLDLAKQGRIIAADLTSILLLHALADMGLLFRVLTEEFDLEKEEALKLASEASMRALKLLGVGEGS